MLLVQVLGEDFVPVETELFLEEKDAAVCFAEFARKYIGSLPEEEVKDAFENGGPLMSSTESLAIIKTYIFTENKLREEKHVKKTDDNPGALS